MADRLASDSAASNAGASPNGICDLPTEILYGLLRPPYLPILWCAVAARVCRRWRDLLLPGDHRDLDRNDEGRRDTARLEYGLMIEAAAGDHRSVIEWLRDEGCPWWWPPGAPEERVAVEGSPVAAAMAGRGGIATVRWLKERGCPWDAGVPARAAQIGDMDALRWLIDETDCPVALRLIVARAAQGGNAEVIERVMSWRDPTSPPPSHVVWGAIAAAAGAEGHFCVYARLARAGLEGSVPWFTSHHALARALDRGHVGTVRECLDRIMSRALGGVGAPLLIHARTPLASVEAIVSHPTVVWTAADYATLAHEGEYGCAKQARAVWRTRPTVPIPIDALAHWLDAARSRGAHRDAEAVLQWAADAAEHAARTGTGGVCWGAAHVHAALTAGDRHDSLLKLARCVGRHGAPPVDIVESLGRVGQIDPDGVSRVELSEVTAAGIAACGCIRSAPCAGSGTGRRSDARRMRAVFRAASCTRGTSTWDPISAGASILSRLETNLRTLAANQPIPNTQSDPFDCLIDPLLDVEEMGRAMEAIDEPTFDIEPFYLIKESLDQPYDHASMQREMSRIWAHAIVAEHVMAERLIATADPSHRPSETPFRHDDCDAFLAEEI